MKTYTVKDIAEMLSVNKETVRRWIRSGRLEATINSCKEGHVVGELELNNFITTYRKYGRKCVRVDYSQDRYVEGLKELLDELIAQRDILNERIKNIQELIDKEGI